MCQPSRLAAPGPSLTTFGPGLRNAERQPVRAANSRMSRPSSRTRRSVMSESIVKEITAVGLKPIVIDGSLANHWFWKFVPVDPLVFNGPMHDGSATQIARQVYHRMLGRIVAENAHGMQ